MAEHIRHMANPLDQPCLFPLDQLRNYYFYCHETPLDCERVQDVFQRFVPSLMGYFEAYEGYSPISRVCCLMKQNDPDWHFSLHHRTYIAEHRELNNWIFKLYGGAPGRGNPMAHILRVPMAHRLEKIVREEGLDQIEIPKKALVPLTSDATIFSLNEHNINEAFIVAAEKKRFFPKAKMIAHIRELAPEQQQVLARQLCTIPSRSGLGDFTFDNNLELAENFKMLVLDTEPLYGELCVPSPMPDIPAQECEGNTPLAHRKRMEYHKHPFRRTIDSFEGNAPTLRKCAIYGLKNFAKSAHEFELTLFEEAAKKQIEQLDSKEEKSILHLGTV